MLYVYDDKGTPIGKVQDNNDLDEWDGHNWRSGHSGQHLGIARLETGEYVLIHTSEWAGVDDYTEVISAKEAYEYIIKRNASELFQKEQFKELLFFEAHYPNQKNNGDRKMTENNANFKVYRGLKDFYVWAVSKNLDVAWMIEELEITEKNDSRLLKLIKNVNLRRAPLRGANLKGATLWGADLREVDLRGANLREVDLRGANLENVNLSNANLRGANLEGANLKGANLKGATLWRVDLMGAKLRGANLNRANLKGTIYDITRLDSAPMLAWLTENRIEVYEGYVILWGTEVSWMYGNNNYTTPNQRFDADLFNISPDMEYSHGVYAHAKAWLTKQYIGASLVQVLVPVDEGVLTNGGRLRFTHVLTFDQKIDNVQEAVESVKHLI